MAIAAALGCDLSVRMFPGTGPRIRDRIQVAMSEALLASLHPRWRAQPEVPVYRPVRGVIDLVLTDATAPSRRADRAAVRAAARRATDPVVGPEGRRAGIDAGACRRPCRPPAGGAKHCGRARDRPSRRPDAGRCVPGQGGRCHRGPHRRSAVAGCRRVVGERRARRGTDPRWAAPRCHGRAIASCGEEDRVPVVRALVGGAVLAGAERVRCPAAVHRAGRRRRGARGRRRVLPGAPFRPSARLAVSAAGRDRGTHEEDRDRHRRHRHALREPAVHGRGRRAQPTSSPAAGSSSASAAGRRSR